MSVGFSVVVAFLVFVIIQFAIGLMKGAAGESNIGRLFFVRPYSSLLRILSSLIGLIAAWFVFSYLQTPDQPDYSRLLNDAPAVDGTQTFTLETTTFSKSNPTVPVTP